MAHKILKVLTLILLVAIVVGGLLTWRTVEARGRLTTTYRRLARTTGDFPLEDPSKVYLLALDTGEKLHFASRIYLPPGYRLLIKHNSGGQHGPGTSGVARSTIARVRIREDDRGLLMIHTHVSSRSIDGSSSGSGSTGSNIGDKALADLLRGRWDEVRVEQLGLGGVATVEPDQPAVLLRLTLPDSMQDEARKKLDPFSFKRYFPVLLDVQLNPSAKKP